MKILLAGPGTGKTTRVKQIIDTDYATAGRILVLSFTNATVHDLTAAFEGHTNVDCSTLHRYALKINHLKDRYILDGRREDHILFSLANALDIDFSFLCEQLGCITFDEMIAGCLAFIKANPAYAKEQIGVLDLLIVDEYQDFNPTERALIDEIARYAADTLILGDDDQSIYGFKDADPEGIITLYQDATVKKLDHAHMCWRCPDVVVGHAQNLIGRNAHRVDKPWAPSGKAGSYLPVQTTTQPEAISYVVSEIEKTRATNPGTSVLVLSPMGFCVDGLVDALNERGIPCVDFWHSPLGDDEYFHVWWLRAIYTDRNLLNLIFLWKTLSPHFRKKLKNVLSEALKNGFDPNKVLKEVRGWYDHPLEQYVGNPPALVELEKEHGSFTEYIKQLDETDLKSSAERLLQEMSPAKEFDSASINIMSIHKSKGLQADMVFILGLVDGVLPNDSRGTDTIEAQRRLLFVGVTRALSTLHLLSWVRWTEEVHKVDKTKFDYKYAQGCYYGKTSRFVIEMG